MYVSLLLSMLLPPDEAAPGVFDSDREPVKIPILMYHRVDLAFSPGREGMKVAPGEFAWQMKYLKEAGFHPITLQQAVRYLGGKGGCPARAVVITFDDGYRDNYRYAFPVLKRYHFTATVFLAAQAIGRTNFYDAGRQPVLPMMGWREIKEMSAWGVEFGSHSLTHPRLTEVSLEQKRHELLDSRLYLETKLHRPVRFFCYPYGRFDAQTEALARAYYEGAVCTRQGINRRGADIFALYRLRINGFTDRAAFVRLLTG